MRGADAVSHVRQVRDRVCVGIDRELHAVPFRPQDQLIGKVEAIRKAVDLHGRTRPRRSGEDRLEDRLDGRPAADEPRRGMTDDRDVRVVAGPHLPLGHIGTALREMGVHGGDAQVKAIEGCNVPVDVSVRVDVELGTVQQRQAA